MAATTEGLFNFIVVRAPEPAAAPVAHQMLMHDDIITGDGRVPRIVLGEAAESEVGRLVYKFLFQTPTAPPDGLIAAGPSRWWWPRRSTAAGGPPPGDAPVQDLPPEERFLTALQDLIGAWHVDPANPDSAANLAQYTHTPPVVVADKHYLVPSPWIRPMESARRTIEAALAAPAARPEEEGQRIAELRDELALLFDSSDLWKVLLGQDTLMSETLRSATAHGFDALYLRFLLRRYAPVDLAPAIHQLQTLHVLELLAVDDFLAKVPAADPPDLGIKKVLDALLACYGSIGMRQRGFQFVTSHKILQTHLMVRPVVHQTFVDLWFAVHPWNPIKPLGVGDLKIVKHWLCGYEISD